MSVLEMERICLKAVRIENLRNWIERGVFAVPELQREFVWNAAKVCDLLDSLYRQYPIGSILVWQTDRRNEGQLRKSLHILPQYNPANREVLFLIDGQQRLSVLWNLICGQAIRVKNASGATIDFGRVYFNPEATEGERHFHYRARLAGDLSKRLVSVVDLLSSGWRRRVRGYGKRVMKRLEECRRSILDYRVFFIFFDTAHLEEVRETFVRINSQGMRLDVADRAFARASRLNMRSIVREVQARLSNGFERIARTTILQTIALAVGQRDLGERGIDAMITKLEKRADERAHFERIWPKLRESFTAAADFLVELGVPNFDFLPSEPMLTTLTLFFFHNNGARPSRPAKVLLQRWFWATSVGARYTGRGYRPNLLGDATVMKTLGMRGTAKLALKVRVSLHTLRHTEYSRPGPLSNAFFCLLRSLKPRFLEDGCEIPLGEISSRRNRSDKHHIFPRGLLLRSGIGPDRFNSLLNICYLVARENQSIGQKSPRLYFADVPRNARIRSRAMASHLINASPKSGIWDKSVKRGFKRFFEQRAWIIARAFERRAGVKLFERGW